MLDYLIDFIVVFGGVYGYYDQYQIIKKEKSVGNFSIQVCAILIICNTLRVFFWFGKQFETALLIQSVLMIIVQILLLKLCVELMNSNKLKKSYSFTDAKFWSSFWQWNTFEDYLQFIVVLIVGLILSTLMFNSSSLYVEFIGLISATIEATLGLPQLIKNYKNRSTKGLSYALIATWTLGDLFKTVFFIFKDQPMQFILCGITQLIIDILIVGQIKTYQK